MSIQVLLNVFCRLKYAMLGGDISDFETCSRLLDATLAMLGALSAISHHLSSKAPNIAFEFILSVWLIRFPAKGTEIDGYISGMRMFLCIVHKNALCNLDDPIP